MIHTSAPATLMLMGEHAVVYGKHALVASADQRLHIYLSPRRDHSIKIDSALGCFECTIDNILIQSPFSFALSVIKQFQQQLVTGFDLKIDSEFSSTVGLGSSAAILAAVSLAMLIFVKMEQPDTETLQNLVFQTAYRSLIEVQGRGSGADLAASILGGIICYRQKPFVWEKINVPLFPITLVYSGYKTATAEVIALIKSRYEQNPEKYTNIFNEIDEATLFAKDALIAGDLQGFIHAFKVNQNLMAALGVVDSTLQHMIDLLNQDPEILAAKVSGSGLGDCILGIGKTAKVGNYPVLTAQLADQGVHLHDPAN